VRLLETIYCTFGGGGGDASSSTAPVGQHPETDGTTGREKMRKGGPDKGGVTATVDPDTKEFLQKTAVFGGGPGSGCKGQNCGRHRTLYHGTSVENAKSILQHGFDPKRNITKADPEDPKTTSFSSDKKTAAGAYGRVDSFKRVGGKVVLIPGGGRGAVVKVRVPAEMLSGHDSVGEAKGEYNILHGGKLDKSYIQSVEFFENGKRTVVRPSLEATSGGQSEGSSLTALKYYVVDGHGNVIHTFRTRDEAESASAGNRYTKVVTHVEQATPMEDTPEVMDFIRRRPGDNQVRTFRKSLPYPNGPFGGSPQG
jgi:hypothetical protein